MPRYPETNFSKARDIGSRWKRNAKFRVCVCGADKREYAIVCHTCWFALPTELREEYANAKGKSKTLAIEKVVAAVKAKEAL